MVLAGSRYTPVVVLRSCVVTAVWQNDGSSLQLYELRGDNIDAVAAAAAAAAAAAEATEAARAVPELPSLSFVAFSPSHPLRSCSVCDQLRGSACLALPSGGGDVKRRLM